MKHRFILQLFLALAALAFTGMAVALADDAPRPAVEVLYIPHEDLARAPGHSADGVFLPLSQLLTLAREAGNTTGGQSPSTPVYCTSVELAGTLGAALSLEGKLTFEAPGEGWSATRIDDGTLPWTAQGNVEAGQGAKAAPQAFLARLGGRTWLFAQGPGQGILPVRGMLPAPTQHSLVTLDLGRFDAPCRIQMDLGSGLRLTSATLPVQTATPNGSTSTTRLLLWPAQGEPGKLWLSRQALLEAPSSLRAELKRTLQVRGAGLEVSDEIILEDRFKAGVPFKLALPSGLRLLRAETLGQKVNGGQAQLETTRDSLTLTPVQDTAVLGFHAVFVAEQQGGQSRPGAWEIPAVVQQGTLTLESSDDFVPLLAECPPALKPAGSARTVRRYAYAGALPSLAVDLVRLAPPLPPRVQATMKLTRSEATIHYVATMTGTHRRDLIFHTPEGWVLADLEAVQGNKPIPCAIQQLDGTGWSVAWDPAQNPETVRFMLHRVGAWGAPGKPVELALPFVRFNGPRPLDSEVIVQWPEQLDVRAGALSALAIVPAANSEAAGGATKLMLRPTGERPQGILEIRGRDADVRATVVTALSVGEDRVKVRALVTWQVSFAPASAFRFLLPSGTGSGVKISGEGIRENTLRVTPEGDEWTVVTQKGIVGAFPLTLEWPLTTKPGREAIEAPRIRLPGVTAQQGFVVLEGSEMLQLVAEAKGLAETDLVELPQVPWSRDSRILGVWRYIDPSFTLRVRAEKFQPDPPLAGLVREAKLTTTIAPEGVRLTRAVYSLMPMSDRQFFEARLPVGAQVWSALVNGEGIKPAHRPAKDRSQVLLVPLPAAAGQANELTITILYQENAPPLGGSTWLKLSGPRLSDPVNRTLWNLNLPPGFEYLTYGGSMSNTTTVRLPLATFLRTAYYPSKLLFVGVPTLAIAFATLLALLVFLMARRVHAQHKLAAAQMEHSAMSEAEPGEAGAKESPSRAQVPEIPKIPAIPVLPSAAQIPQPVKPAAPGCLSGLGSLLIILLIIGILAVIAVPNFFEAQTRSKISRVKSDERTLATALESYYIDNNAYPTQPEILWQGPVKYLSGAMSDPYTQSEYGSSSAAMLRYVQGDEAYERARRAGLVSSMAQGPMNSFWMTYSIGPDGRDDGGSIVYDPSNGTVSVGDVIRIGESRPKETVLPAGDGQEVTARETVFYTDNGGQDRLSGAAHSERIEAQRKRIQNRVKSRRSMSGGMGMKGMGMNGPGMSMPSAPAPAAAMGETPNITPNRAPVITDIPSPITGDGNVAKPDTFVYPDSIDLDSYVDNDPHGSGSPPVQWTYEASGPSYQLNGIDPLAAPQVAAGRSAGPKAVTRRSSGLRSAGLLSLKIEIPEGGEQRKFESLDGRASIQIRLLEQDRFLRLRFIVWIVAFLSLAGLWVIARKIWKIFFILGIALTLLIPVLFQSDWVVFYNTAFQGILFSLVAPLLAWLAARLHRRPIPAKGAIPTALLIMAVALLGPAMVQAKATEPTTTTRILVPYAAEPPLAKADPLAFMSRVDFTRLWNQAHPELAPGVSPESSLIELSLEGTLQPEDSAIHGTLVLRAANPSDTPTSIPLRLAGLALEGAMSDPPGAVAEARSDGLILRMGSHWTGVVRTPFVLPCEAQGSSGHLNLEFPEAAAGLWRLTLPRMQAVAQGPGASGCIAEQLADGTALLGPVRPGRLDLGWSAAETAQTRGPNGEGEGWRCTIGHRLTWTSLAGAGWACTLRLESTGASLPAEAHFALDPGVRIFSVEGESLRSTSVTGGELILRLAPIQAAEITLEGIVIPPTGPSESWNVPGLRAPKGIPSRYRVRLDIADSIQIVSLQPQNLDRRPVLEARQGFSSRQFESTGAEWTLSLDLHRPDPVFEAAIHELFVPGDGFLRQAASIDLTPRESALTECRITMPAGARVLTLTGDGIAAWTQNRRTLDVTFDPPLENPARLALTSVADLATSGGLLTLAPLEIAGAAGTRRRASVLAMPDEALQEVEMAGAAPRIPDRNDEVLMRELFGEKGRPEGKLQGWALASTSPLRLRMTPIQATALITIHNRVTVADGLQSLESVVLAEPRRGRLRQVETLLLLASPDPLAASRLQASGHVRHVRTEAVGERVLRVIAELDAPQSDPVSIRFRFDQPANTEGAEPLRLTVMTPAGEAGSRSFLLLRRTFEGELAPAQLAGARPVEPGEIKWPDPAFRVLPSDRAFELAAQARNVPSFTVSRHTRDEALRAFVETLRLRTIVTADGLERNELEIVLQNQSLQFLKVALPQPRQQIAVYEVQVAGRVVKATFAKEGGREVMLIPLIRTGLLDPELTVRVAYAAQGGAALRGHGAREHRLPEVLDGVPVAQSALVLMLPPEFKYSGFTGSLNRVELVDLEVDEALRSTQRLEKLSESALLTKGKTQQAVLGKLSQSKTEATFRLKKVRKTTEAYGRNAMQMDTDQDTVAREQRLAGERIRNLELAEQAERKLFSNAAVLEEMVQKQEPSKEPEVQASAPQEKQAAPASQAWIEFPRAGEVFAFRQLQGTGNVRYHYASRKTSDRRNDVMLALVLAVGIAVVTFNSRRLFSTRRRVAGFALVLCLIGMITGTALDLAIPGLVVTALVFRATLWKGKASAS